MFLHGLVRDGEGQKMSKTTGNVMLLLLLLLLLLLQLLLLLLADCYNSRYYYYCCYCSDPIDTIESLGCDSLRYSLTTTTTPGQQ